MLMLLPMQNERYDSKQHTGEFISNKSEGQERSRKGRKRKSIEGERKFTVKKQGKGRGMRKEGARRWRKHR